MPKFQSKSIGLDYMYSSFFVAISFANFASLRGKSSFTQSRKERKGRRFFSAALLFIAFLGVLSFPANAQHRDYMSDEEIELVRDAQDIDLRIDTLSIMIDRRFTALGIDSGGAKIKPKNADKWGPEPTGTRLQLFHDIRQLLQKAADDIDDIAGRNEISLAQNKMEGKLFPKAVLSLAASATRYQPLLETAGSNTDDRMLAGTIAKAIELCEAIIESAKKLPPDPTKEEKKKSKA
jgi:hypothetical protein